MKLVLADRGSQEAAVLFFDINLLHLIFYSLMSEFILPSSTLQNKTSGLSPTPQSAELSSFWRLEEGRKLGRPFAVK